MKKFTTFVSAILLSGTILLAQQGTPPLRGPVGLGDFTPFMQEFLHGTSAPSGQAKALLNTLDERASLRTGLMKNALQGTQVYYEPYSFHTHIAAHRSDGSEPQDIYSEGSVRKTGSSTLVREWKDARSYTEKREFRDEGYVWVASAHIGHDTTDSTQACSALAEIGYTPLQVHIKETETFFPVYEGGTGALKVLLTDTRNRWCIDGYPFKLTSMNPEVFTVESTPVTTGADGKAFIRLQGVKAGKGRLRLYLYLAQPETNEYVQVEEYLDVEVLEPEKWTYDISVHDSFTLPPHDYTLSGGFAVMGTLDESNQPLYRMIDFSEASKSDGGTFDVKGGFNTAMDPGDGFTLGFDLSGILGRAHEFEFNTLSGQSIAEIEQQALRYLRGGGTETTNSKNPISALMALLEEGSWSFKTTPETLTILDGVPQQQAESAQEGKPKKEKKKSALRELRDALKELKSLGEKPVEITPAPIATDIEAAQALQIAYVREHHCLAIPDLTQMQHTQLGNMILYKEKAEAYGENFDWIELHGTLTLEKKK